jgi:hypothetical protein
VSAANFGVTGIRRPRRSWLHKAGRWWPFRGEWQYARPHVAVWWRPQDPEDESADLAANLCWKEMSKEKGVVADQ